MGSLSVTDVNLDIAEMLLEVKEGKKTVTQRVQYDQITKVSIGEQNLKKWFGNKSVKVIEIYTKGRDEPYLLRQDQAKSTFDSTVQYLKKASEKNQFTVTE